MKGPLNHGSEEEEANILYYKEHQHVHRYHSHPPRPPCFSLHHHQRCHRPEPETLSPPTLTFKNLVIRGTVPHRRSSELHQGRTHLAASEIVH